MACLYLLVDLIYMLTLNPTNHTNAFTYHPSKPTQGIVELVVKVAQLSDPHSLACRQGTTSDVTAARAARDRAYQHLLAVLQPLVRGSSPMAAPVGAAAAAVAERGAGAQSAGTPLTPTEVRAAKEALIQVGSSPRPWVYRGESVGGWERELGRRGIGWVSKAAACGPGNFASSRHH